MNFFSLFCFFTFLSYLSVCVPCRLLFQGMVSILVWAFCRFSPSSIEKKILLHSRSIHQLAYSKIAPHDPQTGSRGTAPQNKPIRGRGRGKRVEKQDKKPIKDATKLGRHAPESSSTCSSMRAFHSPFPRCLSCLADLRMGFLPATGRVGFCALFENKDDDDGWDGQT